MAGRPDLKAEGKALAGLLADARKKPLNFAMLLSAGGIVVEADKIKSVEAMRKAARAAGGGQGCWGRMSLEGKTLLLDCVAAPPGSLEKAAQRHFSERGHMVRIEIRLAGDEAANTAQPPDLPPDVVASSAADPAPAAVADTPAGEEDDVFPQDPADPDDADDLAAQAGDLKALIAAARKKPYNFACLIADGGVALAAHRRKPPGVLVKQCPPSTPMELFSVIA